MVGMGRSLCLILAASVVVSFPSARQLLNTTEAVNCTTIANSTCTEYENCALFDDGCDFISSFGSPDDPEAATVMPTASVPAPTPGTSAPTVSAPVPTPAPTTAPPPVTGTPTVDAKAAAALAAALAAAAAAADALNNVVATPTAAPTPLLDLGLTQIELGLSLGLAILLFVLLATGVTFLVVWIIRRRRKDRRRRRGRDGQSTLRDRPKDSRVDAPLRRSRSPSPRMKGDSKLSRKERKAQRAKQISEILRIVKDTNHHIKSIHLRITGGGDGRGGYERVNGDDARVGQDLRETERRNHDLEKRIETLGGGGDRRNVQQTDRDTDRRNVQDKSRELDDRRGDTKGRDDKERGRDDKDRDDERRRELERDRERNRLKDDSASLISVASNSRDWVSKDKTAGPSREALRARQQLKDMKIQVGLQYTTYDRAGKQGVQIDDVVRDTAAADAGLRKGDIVLSVDGDAVKNRDAFTKVFKALVAGDRVKLRLERRSSTMNIDLVIGANGVSMREITRLSKVASGGEDDGKGGTVGDRDRERNRGGLDEIPARGRAIGRGTSPPGRGRNIGRDDSLTDRDRSRSRGRDVPLTGGRGYAPEISSTGNVSSGNW